LIKGYFFSSASKTFGLTIIPSLFSAEINPRAYRQSISAIHSMAYEKINLFS
jgi:hypothetical protein